VDEEIANNVKEYLNTSDRFAQRMRASMKGSRAGSINRKEDQKQYFVDKPN
jgi:hypothetical protein